MLLASHSLDANDGNQKGQGHNGGACRRAEKAEEVPTFAKTESVFRHLHFNYLQAFVDHDDKALRYGRLLSKGPQEVVGAKAGRQHRGLGRSVVMREDLGG